jgi:hypothetical protein
MAQVSKEPILLGRRVVAAVSVDGGAVRGEGGPSRPQLVVPLTIQMEPQPAGSTLAGCWIRASLSTAQNASSQHTVGTYVLGSAPVLELQDPYRCLSMASSALAKPSLISARSVRSSCKMASGPVGVPPRPARARSSVRSAPSARASLSRTSSEGVLPAGR